MKFMRYNGKIAPLVMILRTSVSLPYVPYVRAIQYKLGPERLTLLGNSNVLPWTGQYKILIVNRFK